MRVLIPCAIAIAVAVLGVVVWLWPGSSTGSSAVAGSVPKPKPSATAPALSPANVQLLQQAVNSPDRQRQKQALPTWLQQTFLRQDKSLLPAGVTMTIQTSSFRANQTAATVHATLSNGKAFILRLTWESNAWRLLYTVEG